MRFRNQMLTAAGVLLTGGAVACSSDVLAPPTISDSTISADVAANSGETAASEVAGFTDDATAAGSFTMLAPSYSLNVAGTGAAKSAGISPTCTFASGRYTCSATTEEGLSVTRSFAFYDAAGQSLQTYDSTKVESVNFQAQVDGQFQRALGTWTASVHRTRNNTVSGLISLKPQRKWNGVGLGADTATHVGLEGARSYGGTAVDTITNVVMPGKATTSQIPLSGTIVVASNYTVNFAGVTGTATKTVTRRAVVTFDGTLTPKLQIGALTCTLHLDTHTVDGCQ